MTPLNLNTFWNVPIDRQGKPLGSKNNSKMYIFLQVFGVEWDDDSIINVSAFYIR